MSGKARLAVAALAVGVVALLVGEAAAAAANPKVKRGPLDPASTNYVVLDKNARTGQERFFCLARGRCHWSTLACPAECPQRKPKKNKKYKGCFVDCSSRCETTFSGFHWHLSCLVSILLPKGGLDFLVEGGVSKITRSSSRFLRHSSIPSEVDPSSTSCSSLPS